MVFSQHCSVSKSVLLPVVTSSSTILLSKEFFLNTPPCFKPVLQPVVTSSSTIPFYKGSYLDTVPCPKSVLLPVVERLQWRHDDALKDRVTTERLTHPTIWQRHFRTNFTQQEQQQEQPNDTFLCCSRYSRNAHCISWNDLGLTFTFTIWDGVLPPYAEASSGPNAQPHT